MVFNKNQNQNICTDTTCECDHYGQYLKLWQTYFTYMCSFRSAMVLNVQTHILHDTDNIFKVHTTCDKKYRPKEISLECIICMC